MVLEKVNFDDDKLKLIFKNDKVNIILTKKLFLGTGPINTPNIIYLTKVIRLIILLKVKN